jgi:hypothetical protein
MSIRHRSVPPTFARRASPQRPCMAHAQAVVMPHVGHRMPKSTMNEQGGKPSCWWVPCPAGLGRRKQATTNGAAKHNPAKATDHRYRPTMQLSTRRRSPVTLVESLEGGRIPRSPNRGKADSAEDQRQLNGNCTSARRQSHFRRTKIGTVPHDAPLARKVRDHSPCRGCPTCHAHHFVLGVPHRCTTNPCEASTTTAGRRATGAGRRAVPPRFRRWPRVESRLPARWRGRPRPSWRGANSRPRRPQNGWGGRSRLFPRRGRPGVR